MPCFRLQYVTRTPASLPPSRVSSPGPGAIVSVRDWTPILVHVHRGPVTGMGERWHICHSKHRNPGPDPRARLSAQFQLPHYANALMAIVREVSLG